MWDQKTFNSAAVTELQTCLCAIEELQLTLREAQVLSLLLQQFLITEIAAILCRHVTTISKHLESIKRKAACPTLFSLGVKIANHLSQSQKTS